MHSFYYHSIWHFDDCAIISCILEKDREYITSCAECGRENNSKLSNAEESCLACAGKFRAGGTNADNSLVSIEPTSLDTNVSEGALKSPTR